MDIIINDNTFFVFDLDDTLFQEIDFLKSAYRHIARQLQPHLSADIYEEMLQRYFRKENVFGWILDEYKERVPEKDTNFLLKEYREHLPAIALSKETKAFIEQVEARNIPTGLITDGRGITQRNKLKALGIEKFFEDIIISEEFGSEKPDERNYLYFEKKYPGKEFYFFGDNTSKDFIVPIRLGWQTICIKDSGNNIHQQLITNNHVPKYFISSFSDIKFVDSKKV